MSQKSKIFLDSSILIAGLGSKAGASAEILRMVGKNLIKVHISALVIEEVIRNLRKKLPQYLTVFMVILKEADWKVAKDVKIKRNSLARLIPKKSDRVIFETARFLKADYFITFNRKHFHQPAVKEVASFKILTPAQFLAIWRKNGKSD